MYTNGLKDRYGSPLLSLDVGDERYVMMNQIEFSHAKIEEKIESFGKHVQKNRDDIIDLKNKNYNTNVVLNAHRKNEEEHFADGEKKEYKEINELVLGVYPSFDFSTNKTTYTGETEARSIQLDKADFIPGGSVIQEIRLPYKNEPNNGEKYCHISVFDSNSTQIGRTFVSEGSTARTTGSNELLVSKWSFDNIVLPDDYAFVRIALSPNLTLTNLNGDSTFRINVSRNENNQNIIPTNFSKLLSSTQTYLGWVEVTAVRMERQNIKEEFTSIIDNLSTEIRTQFGESLESLRDDIGEDYLTKTSASETYVTNDDLETNYYDKEESADVFVTNEEFNELVKNTQSYYYDTWTNVKNQDSLNPASIKAFQYSKSDFVESRFDRIEFPFQAAGNTGYLCVQFFDSNSQVIENETYFSNNKFAQVGASSTLRKLATFTFDEIYPPEDYAFVRFSFVAEKVAPATIADGLSIKAMYINRSNASWGTYTYLYNDSAARQNLTIYITVLSRKAAKNTGITYRDYDWTPDFFNCVTVTMSAGGKAFVAPTNGWLISNPRKTTTSGNTITINSIEFGYSSTTAQVPVQMLLRKGDVVTSSHAYTVDFYPCKSEQHDYIPVNEHTPYDIWKGAVIYDANGEVSVRDLYVPNASAWKSQVGHAVIGSIARIEDEKAYDSNDNVLFNIQSQYIENGAGMFVQSTITSFDSTLDALTNGTQMFGYSGLTQWNTNLPNLTTGDNMFMACSSLTSFTADLHSLSSGWYFLNNCTNLTDVAFVGGLDALTDGTAMFKNCSLSYTSLTNILNALPARSGNVIEITVADSVKDDMTNDSQWIGVIIPAHSSGSYYEFTHNGWKVRLTSQTGFEIENPFDVSETNGYIPDASQWNTNVYAANNLNIVSVVDGVAYDGLV